MRFNSEAERMQHPEASLIPRVMWGNYRFFDSEIQDEIITLMQAGSDQIERLLEKLQLRSLQKRECAYLALLYSHPSLSDEASYAYMQQLNFEPTQQLLLSCILGKTTLIERIFEHHHSDIIKARGYEAFHLAVENGHLAVIERLMALAPSEVQAMVGASSYAAFRWADENSHLEVVQRLLRFPIQFAYAEKHMNDHGEAVTSFMHEELTSLRNLKTVFETDHPEGVFNLEDPEQARLCFYMLRNLIRRNDAALQDDMLFLMDIPSVRALLHIAVTPPPHERENELLRLAYHVGNRTAAGLLLDIPAVSERAEAANFYRDERQGGFDLRQLALDRESSMTALTEGEQKRLEAVTEKYKPLLQSKTVPHVMAELRGCIRAQYEAHPAVVRAGDGREIELPFSYTDWEALSPTLSADTREAALEAYYQNKAHTAFRYLERPNPFMSADADYVNRNAEGAWSTFDRYFNLYKGIHFLKCSHRVI
jgi:hypothetical protein